MLSLYKLIRFAGLCDIYRTCFNQICAPVCPFFNVNVRVPVFLLENTPIDVTPNKFVKELTKSIND